MLRDKLIKSYKNGELKELGVLPINNFGGLALISIVDDCGTTKVFGYYSNGDNKEFFLRRLYESNKGSYFIQGFRIYLDEFCKV